MWINFNLSLVGNNKVHLLNNKPRHKGELGKYNFLPYVDIIQVISTLSHKVYEKEGHLEENHATFILHLNT